jgi:hypothetical protein
MNAVCLLLETPPRTPPKPEKTEKKSKFGRLGGPEGGVKTGFGGVWGGPDGLAEPW